MQSNFTIISICFLTLLLLGFGEDDNYVNRANEHFLKGDYQKTVTILLNGGEKHSDSPRIFYDLGNIYFELGEFENAKHAYQNAVKNYKAEPTNQNDADGFSQLNAAIDNLAITSLLLGNFSNAILLAKQAQKMGCDNNQSIHTLYYATLFQGDSVSSFQYFMQIRSCYPNDETLISDSLLMHHYLKNELPQKAFLSFLKARVTIANPDEALMHLNSALNALPNNSVFLNLKNVYTASDYLKKKVETDKIRNTYENAKYYIQIGEFLEAEKSIRFLLKHDSENIDVLEMLVQTKLQRKKFQDAIKIQRQIIALRPDMQRAHFNLGYVLLHRGRFKDAKKSFQHTLTLNPNYPEANAWLAFMAMKNGDKDKAITLYKKETVNNPKHETTYYNLAELYYQRGDFTNAAIYFKKVVESNYSDIEALLYCVDSYMLNNERSSARAFLQDQLNILHSHEAPGNVLKMVVEKLESVQ